MLSLVVVSVGLGSDSDWLIAAGLLDGGALIWLAVHIQAPVDRDIWARREAGLPKRVPYWTIMTARVNPLTVARYRRAMAQSPEGAALLQSRLDGDAIWERATAALGRRGRP